MNSPTATAASVHHFLFSSVIRRCLGEPFALAALTALLPALAEGRSFAFPELREARRGRHQLAEGLRVMVSIC